MGFLYWGWGAGDIVHNELTKVPHHLGDGDGSEGGCLKIVQDELIKVSLISTPLKESKMAHN